MVSNSQIASDRIYFIFYICFLTNPWFAFSGCILCLQLCHALAGSFLARTGAALHTKWYSALCWTRFCRTLALVWMNLCLRRSRNSICLSCDQPDLQYLLALLFYFTFAYYARNCPFLSLFFSTFFIFPGGNC